VQSSSAASRLTAIELDVPPRSILIETDWRLHSRHRRHQPPGPQRRPL